MHSFNSLAEDDVLTTSPLHKVMVVFHAPHAWPGWLIGSAGAVLALSVGSLLGLLSRDASLGITVALILLAFFVSDAMLLRLAPQRGISFASWKDQIGSLAVARAIACLSIGLAGVWLGWTAALLLCVAAQFAGTAALYYGALVEPRHPGLTTLTLRTDRLAPGVKPIRILHISDVHVERLGGREARLLKLAHEAQPDLIVMTGDYVNLSNNLDLVTHAQVRTLLQNLHARYGIYSVLGSPPVDLRIAVPALFDGLRVRLLRNEAVTVPLSRDRRLVLLGLDCHHDLARDTEMLARLAAEPAGDVPRILLYHSPELMPQAVAHGIDLYFCGHTHGGQVRLPLIGPILTSSRLGRRYVMGHYHEGRTHLYVSRGIGFEGLSAPRVRFLCPPETTLVTLEAED